MSFSISTPKKFIQNAYLQLSDLDKKELLFQSSIEFTSLTNVNLSIPELNIYKEFLTNDSGFIDSEIYYG